MESLFADEPKPSLAIRASQPIAVGIGFRQTSDSERLSCSAPDMAKKDGLAASSV